MLRVREDLSVSLRSLLLLLACAVSVPVQGQGPAISEKDDAILVAQRTLRNWQLADGAFPSDGLLTHRIGTTCLAMLALARTDPQANAQALQQGLSLLRATPVSRTSRTDELALWTMLLVTLGEEQDLPRVRELADLLLRSQSATGGWPHLLGGPPGDLSISHLVALGLHDAAKAGVSVPDPVWEACRDFWVGHQNSDGGWYDLAGGERLDGEVAVSESTITGTLAGVATLSLCQQMLRHRSDITETDSDDQLCCGGMARFEPLEKGVRWLREKLQQLPTTDDRAVFVAYHLHGLEQGSRLAGVLFEGEQAWMRSGISELLQRRDRHRGHWRGNNDVVATSHAMLYLVNDRRPALISKWDLTPKAAGHSGLRCRHDLWNLTEHFVQQKGWPRLLTAGDLDFRRLDSTSPVDQEAWKVPVLFLTGERIPDLSPAQLDWLREFLSGGGILLASPRCQAEPFRSDFQDLIAQLLPEESAELAPLFAGHPVYRMLFSLDAETVKLEGVETACRTSILYCPLDLSCAWDRAVPVGEGRVLPDQPDRADPAVLIGMNVLAYALGAEADPVLPRSPLAPWERWQPRTQPENEESSRSLLRIGKIHHPASGGTSDRVLQRLVASVNTTCGTIASRQVASLKLDGEEIFDHLLLFHHGHRAFRFTAEELSRLRAHLEHGGVLVADACCSSEAFDGSFRRLVADLFPGRKLHRLAVDHALFTEPIGGPLTSVKIRKWDSGAGPDEQGLTVREEEPFLEGLEIDGRLAIIYSRYDLSCALEGTQAISCEGYLAKDAERITTKIVLHALMQQRLLENP